MQRFIRLGLVAGVLGLAGCGGDSESTTAPPVVVVTYQALASIVSDVVGDAARIEVIVPNGTDPHDFEPSAKDVEALGSAALIVANGLDLEEGLTDALDEAEKSGVPVFRVTDHVTLRNDDDPHVWLDPLTLAQAVPTLAQAIGSRIGIDLSAGGDATVESLQALDTAITTKMSTLDSCVLITGHESLDYFGARYGCEVLGSIIPGFSTAAEATAGDIAALKNLAREKSVRAIFAELGTPAEVAEQLAKEVGVAVVDIATHLVPDGGGYDDMMLALVDAVVAGLS